MLIVRNGQGDAMAKSSTMRRSGWCSKSGSTTLTLDKEANTAVMQRKLLFWSLKPLEVQLTDVAEITLDVGVDRASGVEICNTCCDARRLRVGAVGRRQKDAETTAARCGSFWGWA